MARWTLARLLGIDRHPSHPNWADDEHRSLLPQHDPTTNAAIPPEEVTKIALRLRHLVSECVPCELEEYAITRPHSTVITPKVIQTAKEAGKLRRGDGGEGQPDYSACVVYCLLICKRWFEHQALVELWDLDLHRVRAVACEIIAKRLIETEEDSHYLLHEVLLRRYSFVINGDPVPATNVIEKAVDLHAVRVIGSSGYQKCTNYLWRGWLIQDENDPSQFVDYQKRDDRRFIAHMDPDRMRAPVYQNAAQLLVSILYLVLYTLAINSINKSGRLDGAELLLYVFTLGFVLDEVSKVWKAGPKILGFWNAFNGVLYAVLTLSLVLRLVGLSYSEHDERGLREYYTRLSYNFLAFSAPMFWSRLLLYLDSFRFFGAMLVVLKVMMKESIIFFALLVVMIIGFLQAFIGLDLAEDLVADDKYKILLAMANTVLQSPEFSGFENFAPPFGMVLYYLFTFVVMVILLNILIALYNSAYQDIYDNANDEYLALFAQKTMQFVRAPDENVYIPPLNLVEIVIIALFDWWLPKPMFEHLNDLVMAVLYSPLLVVAAYVETRAAHEIHRARLRGDDDEDVVEEWEHMLVDFKADGWDKRCNEVKSNVEEEPAVCEVRKLAALVEGLSTKIDRLEKERQE